VAAARTKAKGSGSRSGSRSAGRTTGSGSGNGRRAASAGPSGQRARTSRGKPAADRAVAANCVQITLPLVGPVQLPEPQRLVWYAGVATLVAIGMVEWPVALVIAVGHLLSEDHHHRLLQDFGEALEAEA
jgi:hypothetical protein